MKICSICRRCFEDTDTVCDSGDHGQLVQSRPGSCIIADKYRLERLLGRGGMGAVYAGMHVELERPAAIKLLLPDLVSDTQALERFRREARAAARLNHPNVADTYDYGILPSGEAYILMELVEGQTLREYINAAGAIPFGEAVQIARQVADGIEVAHRNGIIHRDLKPSNIILARDHHDALQAKVVDFGIAKLKEYSSSGGILTNTGSLVGTPRYMSPEQCAGHEIDVRSDIYSLGVILYEMLAGRPPFDAPSATAIALKHVQEPPPPLSDSRSDVPEALAHLVMQALAKDPEARMQTAAALSRELRALERMFDEEPLREGAPLEPLSAASAQASVPGSQLSAQASGSVREAVKASPSIETEGTHVAATDAHAGNSQPDTGRAGSPTFEDARREAGALVDEGDASSDAVLDLDMEAETVTKVAAPPVAAAAPLASAPPVPPSAADSQPGDVADKFAPPDIEPHVAAQTQERAARPGFQTAGAAVASPVVPLVSPERRAEAKQSWSPLVYVIIAVAVLTGGVIGWWIAPWRDEQPATQTSNAANSANPQPARSDAPASSANATQSPAPPATSNVSAADAPEAERRALSTALGEWVTATNTRNVERQMSFYMPRLETYYRSTNVARTQVRRDKDALFSQASAVNVSVDAPSISFGRDGRTAVMEFRKQYAIEGRGANSRGEVVQELIWRKTEQGWKIIGERDKRVIR